MQTKYPLEKLKQSAIKIESQLRISLKNINKKLLLKLFKEYHNDCFNKINCLDCANCCRELGPRITGQDIDKISKHLHITPGNFIEKYLLIDEDNDFVFKSMPCPFLNTDNYCKIYEVRPVACREYPHTDSNKIIKNIDILMKNNKICPASLEVSIKLMKHSNA
ncbi:MAG: hypothetical protein Kow0068_22200 [Marinilabiliales bacterium]